MNIQLIFLNRRCISSVGRTIGCRPGGGRIDSESGTNTHGLKITEKGIAFALKTAKPPPSSDDVPSPVGDVIILS